MTRVAPKNSPGRHRGYLHDLPMSDVDWLALWVEFAQATDNEQLEVAERIVYLDGRWDFNDRDRVEGRL